MIITNDLYSMYGAMGLLIGIMVVTAIILIGAGISLIVDEKESGAGSALIFVVILLAVIIGLWTVQYNAAKASVRNTLEEAGYVILDDFPHEVGSDFTAEKDGEILYCLVGNTFEGGNTVRIECKG